MADKISVFVLSNNQKLKEIVSLYLQEDVDFEFVADTLEHSDLYNEVTSLPYSVLLADLNEESRFEQINQIATDCPSCKIVAVKDFPDVKFIVNAIRAGAKDILAYPLIKSDFTGTLARLKSEFTTPKNNQKCRIISVFSNKGGIGKTCIATNLAYELAQNTKDKVALVDLNFQTGDITTFMGLQPTYDISYIFENMKTLDKDLLESLMTKYKETSLYVLSNPPSFEQGVEVSVKTLEKFFNSLKENFSYIIVDMDSGFNQKTTYTMSISNLVLLTTIVSLPALRNCRRCLEMFKKLGFDDKKVQILINRFMENDEVSADDVVEFLEKQIYAKLPNNYFAILGAINKGVLLSEISPNSNLAQSFKELAIHVADSVFTNKMIIKLDESKLRYHNTMEK